MSDIADQVIAREMGYTVAEFVAVLPQAMRDWRVSGGPNDWSIATDGGAPVAQIRTEPRPDRLLGSLRLPVLHVELRLTSPAQAVREEFLQRFDRGFQRGGG